MSQVNEQVELATPDIVTDSGADIDTLLAQMDQVFNESAKSRQKIYNKVIGAIEEMKLDTTGDAELLEAQIRLMEQGDKLIANREKAFLTRIQTRMKKKESDAQTKMYSALTTQVLKDINVNKIAPYVPSQNADLSESTVSRIDEQLSGLESMSFDAGEVRKDNQDMS